MGATGPDGRFAFCWEVTAGYGWPRHLRAVPPEQLLRTDAIEQSLAAVSLCGLDLTAGRDLPTPVTPEQALDKYSPTCSACWRAYLADNGGRDPSPAPLTAECEAAVGGGRR